MRLKGRWQTRQSNGLLKAIRLEFRNSTVSVRTSSRVTPSVHFPDSMWLNVEERVGKSRPHRMQSALRGRCVEMACWWREELVSS